jgi:hypothetical protein
MRCVPRSLFLFISSPSSALPGLGVSIPLFSWQYVICSSLVTALVVWRSQSSSILLRGEG